MPLACIRTVALGIALAWLVPPSAFGDEQTDLLLAMERKMQASQGDKQKIAEIAGEVVERNVDVATLVTMYAADNLVRVAIEARNPPVLVDLSGKRIFAEGVEPQHGGAGEIAKVLIAAQAPDSTFRGEIKKIAGGGDRRVENVAVVLQGTVDGYSMKAIGERLNTNRSKWPFPFCLPNCD